MPLSILHSLYEQSNQGTKLCHKVDSLNFNLKVLLEFKFLKIGRDFNV